MVGREPSNHMHLVLPSSTCHRCAVCGVCVLGQTMQPFLVPNFYVALLEEGGGFYPIGFSFPGVFCAP